MAIAAYTDYPIEDGTFEAGVKEVQVLSYDRNKYCTVLRNGFETEIKAGYIYLDKGLTRRFKDRHLLSLPDTPEGTMRTRQQLAGDLRYLKKVKTKYIVVADPSGRYHPVAGKIRVVRTTRSRAQALKYFSNFCRRKMDSSLQMETTKECSWCNYDTLMYYDRADDTWDYYGKKKPFNHKTLARHGFKV